MSTGRLMVTCRANPVPRHRRPKLGQHFLVDAGYRHRIRNALDIRPEKLVVEIGPGRGAMTQLLAERARQPIIGTWWACREVEESCCQTDRALDLWGLAEPSPSVDTRVRATAASAQERGPA